MRKVSVILSIYNPNKEFLRKQLASINSQTYKNIELVVHDDCPTARCDIKIFEEILTNIDYKILPYKEENLGYSKGFETLIQSVEHDGYIAFCDQDDIWFDNKIEVMVNKLNETGCQFAYCNRNEIDGDDNIIRTNVVNPLIEDFKDDHQKLLTGSPFRTLVPGMSIVCSVSFAKSCIPFGDFAFDKWVSCVALAENTAVHVNQPLVLYRRHGKNVSGVFNGITCKEDYYIDRVNNHYALVKALAAKYPNLDLNDMIAYSEASKNKRIFKLLKYKWINPTVAKFEAVLVVTPDWVFKIILKKFSGK